MTTFEGSPGGLATRASADYPIRARMTGEGGFVAENLSGRWAERTYRGNVSFFSVDAVTLPVVANNLVSVCGIYNPPGSGKMLEIIDTAVIEVLATTVVDAFGWYSSTVVLSAAATFTTAGTARSRRMQDATSSVARVYTAVTHSGTPSLEALFGGHGATTNAGNSPGPFNFNGTLFIPPGVLASVAMSKAASTGSGVAVAVTWADVPL